MPYTDASGVQIPVGTDAFSPTAQFKTWQDKNATYNNRVMVALDTDRTALAAPVLREGLRCYVNATDIEWIYSGTSWVLAWRPDETGTMVAGTGGTVVAEDTYLVATGGVVLMNLGINRTSAPGVGTVIATVPAGLRPTVRAAGSGIDNGGQRVGILVDSVGAVRLYGSTATGPVVVAAQWARA